MPKLPILLAVAALAAAAGCGGSTPEPRGPLADSRIIAYHPEDWIVATTPNPGAFDGRQVTLDDWHGIVATLAVYVRDPTPPLERFEAFRARLLQAEDAEAGDVRTMFGGAYVSLQWCVLNECRLEAIRILAEDPELQLRMQATWQRDQSVNLTPMEDAFRTADYR